MTAQFVREPLVVPFAAMEIDTFGVGSILEWVRSRAPACLPDEFSEVLSDTERFALLFPHDMKDPDGRKLTDNELLVEFCGRKCYNSFGNKAGKKTNREYIEHTQAGDVPHASILYHAKMSFFIAGVSRRVSHELIRNYVGADRDEEGAPSQESSRYVVNAGYYVIPPKYLDNTSSGETLERFKGGCDVNYSLYRQMVDAEVAAFTRNTGVRPTGIDYKRILEAASSLLMHTVETSFVWTTNPMALAKMLRERDHDAADREFQRFAKAWKAICVQKWPNLFPQSWMRATAVAAPA